MRNLPIPIFLVAVLGLSLAGCTSNAPRDAESRSVEQAVSRQAAGTDNEKRAKVHTELGRLYLMEGRYEVALEEGRLALEGEVNYAPAHNLLALVYMALRKNELAEQRFRQALQLAADDPEINNDFGWFLCQTDRAKASLAHFKVAIGNPLFQSPGKALTNAGLCALLIKDDGQAAEYLGRALRLDRGNTSALYWLGDIAYRAGRFDEARQRINDLHKLIEPAAQSAWLALRIDRKLGDRDGEARYMGILNRKYRDTVEYQKMSRGEFD